MLKCEFDVMEYAVTVENELFNEFFGEESEVEEEEEVLKTVEFGTICIVESVDPRFDTFCGWDLMGEWSFWMMPDGEVVALEEVE